MLLPPQQVTQFQRKILDWYQKNQRDLPWRKDRDPYHILVSEIMLQQTQVARVIPKYVAWLEAFPTVEALAKSQPSEVLTYWSGLGYNRRALNLHRAAQHIVSPISSQFPLLPWFRGQSHREGWGSRGDELLTELRKLPGIGEYTAAAIACFAFDLQVPVIDTNIRKVLTVHFCNGELPDDKTIKDLAQQLLPVGKAYEWNQALMDYAGAELQAHKIPIPKQSTFIGSNRYYRGQILKKLIEHQSLAVSDIGPMIKGDYTNADQDRLKKVIDSLIKDRLVIQTGDKLKLP